MYSDQLDEQTIAFDQIFLDPNNPRFWTEKTVRDVPDEKISGSQIQDRTLVAISQYGISELRDSIIRNGFLPLDRIVVRPIAGKSDEYVIVEGNRRFAALTVLRQEIADGTASEEGLDDDQLQSLYDATNSLTVLVYHGADTHDISWLLQGIRHISGIRPWLPAQRARLVSQQIDNNNLTFRAAGQKFGLSAQAVGRLYRAYNALEQMRKHDEFSGKAKNEYFTLFEESIRNRDVRDWLGWDNMSFKFENESNLAQFYSWICPDEDHNDQRRIHDPRQIKSLGVLLAGGHYTLLNQIDSYEETIEQALAKVEGNISKSAWKDKMQQARNIIADLPQQIMFEEPDDFLAALLEIEQQVHLRKSVIENMKSK